MDSFSRVVLVMVGHFRGFVKLVGRFRGVVELVMGLGPDFE